MRVFINISVLRERLTYDPITGDLRWKKSKCGTALAGSLAGTITKKGHKRFRICGRCIMVHRAVWALSHGEWPTNQIDHINGNPGDNRLQNLRLATNAENQRNAKTRIDNTSRRVGVYWAKHVKKWRPMIRVDGKNVCLGLFVNYGDAVAARERAEDIHYGGFARRR